MGRIIAFIDGSVYSDSVLDHAAWAAKRLDVGVDVVHVIGRRDISTTTFDLSGSLMLGARTNLLNELAELDAQKARLAKERGRVLVDSAVARLKEAGVKEAHARLRRGDILDAVQDLEPDADLIVIGKRGEAADFAKLHLGSNLERVARASTKPVIVASRGFQPPERFMIAFDGGVSATKAVAHIAQGKLFPGLECHIVMAGKDTEDNRGKLDATRLQLANAGYKVATKLADVEPEALIADYVIDNAIQFLVMGAYGHSRIRTLIIGSTTTEMIRSVTIPVLLFR
ncbi:universal stress protein [Pelagibacterium xiamenense]|uniref:universal stress protein n=1 Tax=Pelagibacterium xiamenense TaxID=2901140 RepID=UPI001E2D3172|nr:universal stress protein [Pelagibacterium xiamenense]